MAQKRVLFESLTMKMRVAKSSCQRPSAPHTPNLFHDSGLLESKALSYSLKSIFVPTSHMLLVDVSGSGETRIVWEGLLRNRGLYFVCQDDGTLIGSKDLPDALVDGAGHGAVTVIRMLLSIMESGGGVSSMTAYRQVWLNR
ncbi:hypothetical protein WG66_013395 [Moniliophthora roreri]|nr:hypothetical protein WG66_013395 [Moniliophthora roreri]